MSEIELKACPFCGAGEKFLIVEHMEGTVMRPAFCIRCDYCGASCSYTDRGDHRKVWNTRAPQWKPIETAPKDGTEILAWDGQGQATIHWSNGRWSLVYAGWRAEDGDFDGAISWQPLPAAPEVKP